MEHHSVGKRFYLRAAFFGLLTAALLLSSFRPAYTHSAATTAAASAATAAAATAATAATFAPPDGLTVVETDSTVTLSWNAVTGAAGYRVYRSTSEGLGYSLVTAVPANLYQVSYTIEDGGLVNQTTYYYVVTTIDPNGGESAYSNEIAALPHLVINWVGTLNPQDYGSYTIGSADPVTITGKVHIPFHTGPDGPAPGVIGQLGYGTAGTAPVTWTHWVDAVWKQMIAPDEGPPANDWYSAAFRPEAPGSYNTVYRFSTTGGRDWVYGGFQLVNPDLLASGTNVMGTLTVLAGSDSTAPTAPGQPSVVSAGTTSLTLTWGAASDDTAVYRYDVLRAASPGGPYTLAGSVDAAANPLQYQDTGLVAGTKYYYVVQALDTSYNRSASSPELMAETTASIVPVTIRVSVPDFTPPGDTIYLNQVVNADGSLGAVSWTAVPITPDAAPYTFTASLSLREGTRYAFRVSRGSQATVQTNADGDTPAPAPDFTAAAGMATVQRAVLNWDDPIAIGRWPNAPKVEMLAPLSVTWSQPMPSGTAFTVTDITSGTPVNFPGTFRTDPATRRTIFKPAGSFTAGRSYAVSVSGQPGLNGSPQVVPLSFNFEVLLYHVLMPWVGK